MMANEPQDNFPPRVVCLAAEAAEILDALGCFDRVVGVSAFTAAPPQAQTLPRIGGFSTPDLDKILALEPDLVITISDIQAQIAGDLIRRGIPVLALNPHRLDDVWQAWRMVGGVLGVQARAAAEVAHMQERLAALASHTNGARRPRVYFEEWPDPTVSGIGWVSDLIHQMGGEDIFHALAEQTHAPARVIAAEAVIAGAPDVIIASWCGKRADLAAMRQRPGWERIPAVQRGHVYEIESDTILQIGPSLVRGAEQMRAYIQEAAHDLDAP
jgi:iron complex transport system substrate-binding protein